MSSNLGFIPFQYQGLHFHKPLQLHKFPRIHSAIDRHKRHKRRNRVGLGRRKFLIKSMKAVIQRVASASVEVEGRTVSAIGPGLLVLVGLHESDLESDAEYICRKVLNMRLYPNEKSGKTWDQNVMQRNYEVLLVSQFTLYGVLKGNKPDFHVAMPPEKAKLFYASLVEKFRKAYNMDAVKDGVFGAMMKVNLVNDGPVTMQLDSAQSSR
ncbi:D-tyrosyl-tRNA(Tyr) deacylase [Olea europaea subsp. europaea]|nr:D-tyrosyl-tRNA(Tyr) deacylase [Olea europaea subsp. europaea]